MPSFDENIKKALYLLVCNTAVFIVVTQRRSLPLWGGALRDDPKNGCVADYVFMKSLENAKILIHLLFFSGKKCSVFSGRSILSWKRKVSLLSFPLLPRKHRKMIY